MLFIYITGLASDEIFSPSNKIHHKVGRTKNLSALRYEMYGITAGLLSFGILCCDVG